LPLLDRLPPEFIAGLTPRECLALRFEPRAYLRPRQLPPADPDWLVWMLLTGRGWGKSFAAAAWVAEQLKSEGDVVLAAPTLEDCWTLQWETIRAVLPPWVRYVERVAKNQVLFPDTGARILMTSAYTPEAVRGLNARAAWLEEASVWVGNGELWRNLQRALRVPGPTPPRAVFTLTPPKELTWVLELCTLSTTRVVRGAAWENPSLDPRAVAAWYEEKKGTIELERELNGSVVLGHDGALFSAQALEDARVQVAPQRFTRVVVACDPAQGAGKYSDTVGLVCCAIQAGHIYVLASCSERLSAEQWSTRALQWARQFHAGQIVVEPTGSGGYPRATLDAQQRLGGFMQIPIIESPARGSKADRAMPLSAAAAAGRLHIVGRQEQLERELTQWFPGASFSPGGLDALVHGCAAITNNWNTNLL